MTEPEFTYNVDRDAWATIRGFVYQVQHTILTWLKIDNNDELQLECGEDIDIVRKQLEKDDIRNLAQVKYRESATTLNSDYVLESIKNFVEHKTSNRKWNLTFRFITSNGYGKERPPIFEDDIKGIDAWIELSNGEGIDQNGNLFKKLNEYLLKKARQKATAIKEPTEQKKWDDFVAYIGTPDKFAGIVKGFHWSFESGNQLDIKGKIHELLNLLRPGIDAEPYYERLFVFVFKTLSQPGLKILNAQILNEQLDLVRLTDFDNDLLNILKKYYTRLEDRITSLEATVSVNSEKIEAALFKLDDSEKGIRFDFFAKTLSTSPPEIIATGSERARKVEQLLGMFQAHPFISVIGMNGTGKTQLASILSRKFDHTYWLNLGEFRNDSGRVSIMLKSFLSAISGEEYRPELHGWVSATLSKLPQRTILVLNDLPKLTGDMHDIINLICALGNESRSHDCRLLVTSNHELPIFLIESLKHGVYGTYDDLEFTDEETREILIKAGAEEKVLEFIPIITATAKGNARMIAHIVHHLKSINWGKGGNDLLDIFIKSTYTPLILENTQESINRYLADSDSKELLYRLSLINWKFGMEQIVEVSEVDPSVNYPKEKLSALLNVWVQAYEGHTYEVSPLAIDIGRENLSKGVLHQTYIAIGNSIAKGKTINQITGYRAISSYIKGNDYRSAGELLHAIYQHTIIPEHIKVLENWGFLRPEFLFDKIPKMEVKLQIMICKEKLRLYIALKKDLRPIVSNFQAILDDPRTTPTEGAAVRMLFLSQFKNFPDIDQTSNVVYIVENWDDLETELKETFDIEVFKAMMWSAMQQVLNKGQLENWLAVADKLKKNFDLNVFNYFIAQPALRLLCSELSVQGRDSSHGRKNTLNSLESISKYFELNNFETMQSIVVSQIVENEVIWYDDIDRAVAIAIKYLTGFKQSEAKFLLFLKIGNLYFNQENFAKAYENYQNAIDLDCRKNLEYPQVLINVGRIFQKRDDPTSALAHFEMAKEIANSNSAINELEYVKIIGELTVAYWLQNEREKCFSSLEEQVERLFASKDDMFGDLWINLLFLTGHFAGYVAGLLNEGYIPKVQGEDFFSPYSGMFTLTADFTDRYDEKNEAVIMIQLSFIACRLKLREKAYDWSTKAFDLARKNSSERVFQLISDVSYQFPLINFKTYETLEMVLLFAARTVYRKDETEKEWLFSLPDGQIVSGLLAKKPSELWNQAEESSITIGVLPLFVMLLTEDCKNSLYLNRLKDDFFGMLEDYLEKASDKTLFINVHDISLGIFEKSLNLGDVTLMANEYLAKGRFSLQILCILGASFISEIPEQTVIHLVNIAPALVVPQGSTPAVIEYAFAPYVKEKCIAAIKEGYVGSRSEIEEAMLSIESFDDTDKDILRKMLDVTVKLLDIKITDNSRVEWLNNPSSS